MKSPKTRREERRPKEDIENRAERLKSRVKEEIIERPYNAKGRRSDASYARKDDRENISPRFRC